MSTSPIKLILSRLPKAHRNSHGWLVRCPAHDDREPSLSISEGDDGRVLLHCHAGCTVENIVTKIGLEMRGLFAQDCSSEGKRHKRGEGAYNHPETGSTAQPSQPDNGLTLEKYSQAKRLPVEFLRRFGLKEIFYVNQTAVRIPYYDEFGNEGPVRFRLRLNKSAETDGRFRWRKGSKVILYGLWRLEAAHKAGYAVRVEGESDCHTLWFHGIPAFGIPGASNWNEEWAHHFDDIPIIYDVVEPDKGGDTWLGRLAESSIRDRVHLVRLDGAKDASELHCADPDKFLERWQAAVEKANPWSEYAQAQAETETDEAWQQCASLAKEPRILDGFAQALKDCGVAGESRTAKLIYLAVTSRFLGRPVSVAVKGPSAGGKSYITERVLDFFPKRAYYALSAMSERALAYSDEPLTHRFLVVYEAAGLRGDFATYLVRSLLSEGRLRYETVEKTSKGLQPRLIEREGPTGLIVTTTSINLHPENETRMLSLLVTDTPEQTRRVLLALADGTECKPDLTSWQALQTWLEHAEHRISIPYARALAEKVPPVATRLRRDFTAILNLIRANALLHQAQRDREIDGRVIAALEDYEVVRELVADLVADGVEASIAPTLREAIEAVRELTDGIETNPTNYTSVAKRLGLDKATALRRVRGAIERGYVKNLEDRKGREAKLVCGEPLQSDLQVLPLPSELPGWTVADGCNDDATEYSQQPQQDKEHGCRVSEDSEANSPPPPNCCADCGGPLDNRGEPLCSFCAATQEVFA